MAAPEPREPFVRTRSYPQSIDDLPIGSGPSRIPLSVDSRGDSWQVATGVIAASPTLIPYTVPAGRTRPLVFFHTWRTGSNGAGAVGQLIPNNDVSVVGVDDTSNPGFFTVTVTNPAFLGFTIAILYI